MIFPAALLFFFLFFSSSIEAAITKIVIEKREPFAGGHEFPLTGAYEKLVGKAYGEVDPKIPLNQVIVNLDKAPKNSQGKVEYWIDLYILKPVDMRRGNKTILYDVVNRGRKMAMRFNAGAAASNDPSSLEHAGDGFLMRQGYALVWSGWQGDLTPGGDRQTAGFPAAKNPDGSAIRRWIRSEFVFDKPSFSAPLSFDRGDVNLRSYPAVEASMAKATLTRRAGPHAKPQPISRGDWSFARCPDGKAQTASATDVCLATGFSPDFIYELTYEARDPIVMGLGFAAARDLISFLRNEKTPANPLAQSGDAAATRETPRWAIAYGSSQSGRFLKDFVYQGFNQDEGGKIVFDGVIAHLSGSRRAFINYEFGMPGRFSTGVEGHYYPGDQFPFTYETIADPINKKTDGLLLRCRQQKVCPKIMHWDSATEPWQGRSSLVETDPRGKSDAPLPENIRLYYFAGTQHLTVEKPARGICQQLSNPNTQPETQRALLAALQEWIGTGREPPKSRYPRIADGTLVSPLPQKVQGFPIIPWVTYNGKFNDLFLNDLSAQPVRHVPASEYRALVPKVDGDGNEISGIRPVATQVPLATLTGWNYRADGFMEDELCYLTGSYIPFSKTKAERQENGDPRPSIEERYKDRADYVQKVSRAARALVEERFLLPEDAERIIEEAKKNSIFAERKSP